jgi:hypothetical protein
VSGNVTIAVVVNPNALRANRGRRANQSRRPPSDNSRGAEAGALLLARRKPGGPCGVRTSGTVCWPPARSPGLAFGAGLEVKVLAALVVGEIARDA